jgi:hypothetical protein
MALNLAIENVRRGGSLAELESSMFWATLAGDERAELYQENAVRSHDRARSKHTDTEGT